MKIWGIHKKYKSLSWVENFMSGHISIGPITIYGYNAMYWAINIYTKRFGVIAIRPPSYKNKKWIKPYFYISPNGTPWASTFYLGPDGEERWRSKIRREWLGLNFNSIKFSQELFYINSFFDYRHYIKSCSERKVIFEKYYG